MSHPLCYNRPMIIETDMRNELNKWTSHNELNAEPCKARIHRLQRHNAILNIGLAVMVPAIVVLFFATLVIACA
jgi:hypothetical protein